MKRTLLLTLALLASTVAAQTVPPVDTTEPAALRNPAVIPPEDSSVTNATLEANKRIVTQWHYEFFDLGHFRQADDKYMAADFVQNDHDEKSGREAYTREFETNGYKPRPSSQRPPKIAVFAQNDLVMTVIPNPGPNGAWDLSSIHCNMYRLKNGRIEAMWVAGIETAPKK